MDHRPVLLCGLGHVGRAVLEHLQAAGLPVVVVDNRCTPGDSLLLKQSRLVQGDCRLQEVLEQAGVAEARGVLIVTSDDLVNISTALMVRRLNPHVRIVVRMFNQNLMDRLGKAVTNVFALSTSTLTAPLFAMTALTGQVLGTFRLQGKDGLRQIAALTLTAGSPLRDQTIAELSAQQDAQIVAHRSDGFFPRYLLDLDPHTKLQAGDQLVVCGDPPSIAALAAQGTEAGEAHVLWAGWLRRMWRMGTRTLAEIDKPVLICTAVLLFMVIVSTIIFHLGVKKFSLAGALFRTISVMATGADMGERDFDEEWLKVFVSVLRIVGATLTAAFTAIVTNYLLRARLGGALEFRRIPDSGHVIVCGLGNIGFRIVQELVRCDEQVVVIEQARDGRFVATARRLGVAVVIGDATVREVLRQANAGQARAVIAATSNDLINLETALLVRDLNPHQRVVVRLYDPELARTLREAADVQLALSVPTLAAPAFVAGLFGDRVQSVFQVEGRMLAVVNVQVQEQDANLLGQTIAATAAHYHLLPVALLAAGEDTQRPAPERCLNVGDRLAAIVALSDLERLLRRDGAAKT